MPHLDIDPYTDAGQPTGIKLSNTRDTLRKSCEYLPAGFDKLVSTEMNSVPFGICLEHIDLRDWLLLDQKSGNWAQFVWERGSFHKSALFVTKSLSDACNFFSISSGHWPDLHKILRISEESHAHIYAKACEYDHKQKKYIVHTKRAFEAVEKRFQEHRLPVHMDENNNLVSPTLRLFALDNIFCLENSNCQNQCWFGHLGDALQAMLVVLEKTSIVKPDQYSLFPQLDAA